MTEEEKKQLENHFESALNDLVSGIKDTTATEVVMREQQMILFYKRVMLEIEKRDNLISKLQADIEIKDKVIDLIIDDFQTEGYFKKMTYEQVKKYYDNRNELKQEINTLPLNLDLTAK